MSLLRFLFFLILKGCFGYMILAYALRWYEVSNQPDYWRKYGDRTLFGAIGQGLTVFGEEYLFLVLHLLFLAADYLLWPYYYWQGKDTKLIGPENLKAIPLYPDHNPIILLHGYMMKGSTLWYLRHRLQQDDRCVWLFNYGPAMDGIPHFARQLKDAVDEVLAITGQKKVDLIGHSMGGLVIRYYLTHFEGDQHVERVITLGAPHNGSKLWAFALGECGAQMRPNSRFLQELQATPHNQQVEFTAIYSDFDELVLPHENARLNMPGVENEQVSGLGHVGLIFSKSVYNLIKEALIRRV